MSDQTIQISAKVLRWAAKSMGWDLANLATKVNVPTKSITNPRSENYDIEIRKLKKIAKILKRPLAVLLLPEPPAESELVDFRKLPNNQKKLSEKTYQAIRKTRYWQSIARDLLNEQHQRLLPLRQYYVDRDNAQKAAGIERKKLGFESKNLKIKNANEFYNKLRDSIESHDIFVHQFHLSLKETRGFALPDGPPYAIVVNTADEYPPRNFTLLHEYAHVLLQKVGICLPNLDTYNPSSHDTERWCNDFAAAFLMPETEFLNQIFKYRKNMKSLQIIQKLSSNFKVSKKAVMMRIRKLIPHTMLAKYCRDNYDKYTAQEEKDDDDEGGGYVDWVTLCKSQRGSKFIKLVLDSKEQQLISYNDVADHLDLDLKNLPKLEEKVYGSRS